MCRLFVGQKFHEKKLPLFRPFTIYLKTSTQGARRAGGSVGEKWKVFTRRKGEYDTLNESHALFFRGRGGRLNPLFPFVFLDPVFLLIFRLPPPFHNFSLPSCSKLDCALFLGYFRHIVLTINKRSAPVADPGP